MENKIVNITKRQMGYISYLLSTISLTNREAIKSKLIHVEEPWGLKGKKRDITKLLFEEWVSKLSMSQGSTLIDILTEENVNEFEEFLRDNRYHYFVRVEQVKRNGIVDPETDYMYVVSETKKSLIKEVIPF